MHLRTQIAILIAASITLPGLAQSPRPADPVPAMALATLPQTPIAASAGSLTGRFVYTDGSPVSAVDVDLRASDGSTLHATSGADGEYTFAPVPAGAFTVTARADSLEGYSGSGTMPGTGVLALPDVTLQVTAVISVNAISQEEAAEAQVQGEEHQRILGAIPNFLVTYAADPVPLSTSQKYRLTLRTLFDPANVAVSLFVAGGEQATRSYTGFGNGVPGYARRFGASFGDGASNVLLTGAILPSMLHQDPRYFYQGSGSVVSRLGNVLRQALEQRGDNGRWQPAWSNTIGDVGSALISTTYYPHQNTSWGTVTGENFGIAIASQGIEDLLQEFVFGRFTTHRAP